MKRILSVFFLLLYCSLLVGCIKYNTDSNGDSTSETGLNNTTSPYYTSHDFYNMSSSGSLHILKNYRIIQQSEEYSCGCAALLSVLNYYGINEYNEMDICKNIGTSELTGSSPDGIISFINEIGLNNFHHSADDYFFSTPENFEDYIINKIDAGFATLVEWLDWGGHWQVIIGIDTMGTDNTYDDVLIMADSSDDTDHNQDGYYIVPLARFFYMWEDASFTETKYKQTFITVFPKP